MTPDTVRLLPFGSGRPPAKTLGGIQTNLDAQAFATTGNLLEGLYAVGEAAGFGGGVAHGYNTLEGTFLGQCVFTGRTAGRAIARVL